MVPVLKFGQNYVYVYTERLKEEQQFQNKLEILQFPFISYNSESFSKSGYSTYETQVWTVLFKFGIYSKSNLILKLRITCCCRTWKTPWTTHLVFHIKCHKEIWYLMQGFHTYSYSSFISNWTNYFMRGTMSPPLLGGLTSWETITGLGWLHFYGTRWFGSWRNSLFFLKSWKKNLSLKCWESCDLMD